jgi:hypothetical protein
MTIALVILAFVVAGSGRLPTSAFAAGSRFGETSPKLDWIATSGGGPDSRLAVAYAQAGATVEVDPIRCWWQTSKGAVSIGEVFELSITCAVLENQTVQVVPDESRLAVSSIQLQPFEILGGSHPADTRAGGRRFLQHRYSLRLIDPGAFGADIRVPQQQVHYRVQTRVAADAALQGRDLIYLLPAIPLRVLSQVPREAEDIRDGSRNLLDRAAALGTRAGILEVAAAALVAIGLVLAVAGLVRALVGARVRTARGAGRAPEAAILRAVSAELEEVQRRAGIEGWTTELVQRALAAARIVAAAAGGGRISQRKLDGGRNHLEGRLLVTHGWPKKATVAVSSAQTTAPDQGLGGALGRLTSAAYGGGTAPNREALDEAVAGTVEAARQLVRQRTGPVAWTRARLAELRG